jgi:response regulator RpfG family c-di-GMP phosphodiesterase
MYDHAAESWRRIIDAGGAYMNFKLNQFLHSMANALDTMAAFYHLDGEITLKLSIAADLHYLGKLVIGSAILDKPGKLTWPFISYKPGIILTAYREIENRFV